ncbi:uncharacterized protein LOC117677879 [Pantherophis guttatus]|uniref:Uncharacterized protein LOC117677879 n=1 Tax=Pantherophis guttatus TaxID=94885 RepID=A0A6P9DF91_PANGU|nr:uncharacterized protein LOC117677879 [Pantherophis guttatus]
MEHDPPDGHQDISSGCPSPSMAGITAACCQALRTLSMCHCYWLILLFTSHVLKPPGFQLAAAAENVTIDVRVDPDDPDIGWDVALSPSGMKTNILACHWYRGETNNFFEILAYHPKKNSVVYGPASRHRERIRPDCTLLIRDVIVTDSDFYAVYKNTVNRSEVGTATLIVRDRSYYAVERRTMSPLALLGIIVSSGTGFAFIVSLMLYRTVGRVKRPARATELGSAEVSQAKIESQIGSQQRLSTQNILPGEENRMLSQQSFLNAKPV